MNYLRSLLFSSVLYLSIIPYGAWVLLAVPFGRSASYRAARGWAGMNLWMARVIFRLDYEVSGLENIPDQNTVVYAKHTGIWEALAMVRVFPEQTWVVKRELYWIPYFGWALAALQPVAINRNAHVAAVKQVLVKGSQRIRDGLWVIIFPEGTRMPPATTRRYGLSGALLATETGRKIVPVAHNAEDFWAHRGMLFRGGTVKMVIGPAIETTGREPEDINEEAQTWIEQTMRQISASYKEKLIPPLSDPSTL